MNKNDVLYSNLIRGLQGRQPSLEHPDEMKNGLGYDEKRDIEFFDCEPETWLTLQPGEFALFFPNDAHAPLVGGEKSIRKAVFKIRVAE